MSEQEKTIEIEVLRYNPETDAEPHQQVIQVPFTDDMSVLQGVQYIKDYLDGSLSFRWSCRMAICGSCGMMINGIPNLSCQTFLRDYYPGRVRVEALSHFPIERDLVINMEGFIEKLESIQPYIIPKEARPLAQDFVGPAALALLHRYNIDSRDGGQSQRMELVNSEEGVFNCTAVGYCSEVCPKHVDPANAVNQNKTNSAMDYFLRFLAPKGGAK